MAKSAFTVPFYPIASAKEIARAQRDPHFRRRLMVSNLKNLEGLMATLRAGPDAGSPDLAPLLREGAALAARLAELIASLPEPAPESDPDSTAAPPAGQKIA